MIQLIVISMAAPFHLSLSLKLKTPSSSVFVRTPITATLPARDRVIDFGKHKGKMLGTLPQSYLKWVSSNLRARDFEEWAKLADQVLQDPVYNDRVEWEFAENVLNGNRNALLKNSVGAVSELLEISERFGWDNDDKAAWRKINFELLGTSKGGRIPKISDGNGGGGKKGDLGMKKTQEEGTADLSDDSKRRRARRARLRKNKDLIMDEEKKGIPAGNDLRAETTEESQHYNPFPGREALLKKVINGRRFL